MPAENVLTFVSPIPKTGCPKPPESWDGLGKPIKKWVYRNAGGEILSGVLRFDGPGGTKRFRPITLWSDSQGILHLLLKAPPSPRAIYSLHLLAKRPESPVLVVEGEKAADAASKLFPGFVVTTSGSATSASSADWSPLAGRDVVIWPDADEPGRRYAEEAQRHARAAGAASVVIVVLPPGAPDKWDLADFESNPIPGLDTVTAVNRQNY